MYNNINKICEIEKKDKKGDERDNKEKEKENSCLYKNVLKKSQSLLWVCENLFTKQNKRKTKAVRLVQNYNRVNNKEKKKNSERELLKGKKRKRSECTRWKSRYNLSCVKLRRE